ncbi:hypothetical protein MML48_6g00015869 [Holotrichia oblita]|uniref:Uncharacterized protein n=1 Tax=Holotrichia oblita TaxID=644536 RepID=A0ACB9SXE1_HOLOL|nr:hypothetical protein MML48_6g00015869 [Holotrichia oblita]
MSPGFATDCMTPNDVIGVCVELQTCKKLFDQVLNDNKDVYPFIRASRCDPKTDTTLPKVCCGPDINFTNTSDGDAPDQDVLQEAKPPQHHAPESVVSSTTTTTTTPPPPPSTGHAILPRICGKQKIVLENKIYGGKEASIGEFPWLARLVHINKYNRTNVGCSGFLIHRKFVLTAAHCIVGKGIEHLGPVESLILGVHNDTKARICTTDFCTDPPRNVLVLTPIIHPNYDSNTHNHDIALIPLKERVPFTDYIKAICLPQTTTNASLFTISGWGRTEIDITSRSKLKVDIPRANRALCEQQYRTIGLSISDKQICAGGESGHDSCSGDSGGPLMAMGDRDTWYAEGIVSFGNSCGRQGWPGVYTYIPKYYDWILEQIRTTMKTYNITR